MLHCQKKEKAATGGAIYCNRAMFIETCAHVFTRRYSIMFPARVQVNNGGAFQIQ